MAAEIAAFAGQALPQHFTATGSTVSYQGPAEWSFRRMILHYAKLCTLAGGVDAFIIGSELRGLTTLRAAGNQFPFVAALKSLAAEVKSILPSAQVSYDADWTEYSGHQPADGTGDVFFHLDPLWSSPQVDFIGINNYMPLADWRDGDQHTDYLAGVRSVYELSYLKGNIAGGEGFDWYYRNAQDRAQQLRGGCKPSEGGSQRSKDGERSLTRLEQTFQLIEGFCGVTRRRGIHQFPCGTQAPASDVLPDQFACDLGRRPGQQGQLDELLFQQPHVGIDHLQ